MSRFTSHASERLFDRTSVDRRYVKYLIDNRFCVLLGDNPGTTRRHYLFYSDIDDCCFVAVVDEVGGDYVTILPVNFHHSWRISLDAEWMAKDLAINKENSKFFVSVSTAVDNKKVPIYCYIFKGGSTKGPIGLGKFWTEELEELTHILGDKPKILKEIEEKLEQYFGNGDCLLSIYWSIEGHKIEANPEIINKFLNST